MLDVLNVLQALHTWNEWHELKARCTERFGRRLVIFCLIFPFFLSAPARATDTTTLNNVVFKAIPLGRELTADDGMGTDAAYAGLMRRNFSPVPYRNGNPATEEFNVAEYQNRIADIESNVGPYAIELSEVLHSLGLHYQSQQQHEQALAVFAREEHINRIHFGLFSENQIPAVKAEIRSYIDTGLADEADDKQRYLIYLLEKCYGAEDPHLLPELISYGEWNMSRFNEIIRFRMSDMPLFSFSTGTGTQQEFRELAFNNLDQAVVNYSRAVNVLIHSGKFDDPALYQLENRLIESAFFQANRFNMLSDPDRYILMNSLNKDMYSRGSFSRAVRDAFDYGKESYLRQLAYIHEDPNGSLGRYIETLMALGDWYVLFGKMSTGYEKYREANELLKSMEIPEHTIEAVMRPEVPVSLPTFTPTPYSPENAELRAQILGPYRGYIDVSFSINRNGNARDIEVLDSSDDTDRDIERRLVSLIHGSRFRPRFDGDELSFDDQVSLRYYYAW